MKFEEIYGEKEVENPKKNKLPYFPDEDSIVGLLDKYASAVKTLKDSYANKKIDITKYYNDINKYRELYAQAFKLLFFKEDISYGDIFLIKDFVRSALAGYFIPYDGTGYYADFNGNEIGNINWDNPSDYPEEAVYVIWYNK